MTLPKGIVLISSNLFEAISDNKSYRKIIVLMRKYWYSISCITKILKVKISLILAEQHEQPPPPPPLLTVPVNPVSSPVAIWIYQNAGKLMSIGNCVD